MFVMLAMPSLHAQQPPPDAHALQARKHLAGRTNVRGQADAAAELRAQAQHAALLLKPRNANLTAAWTPLGPSSVLSVSYGNVTGRVTSIAFDASDTTGNTLFLGTTGGGVWKSTNAGGAAGAVTFAPLTDTLSVFSQSAGASITPSLSIGAVAVQPVSNGIVLAGTGDPNDATDSLYGEGLLRSADGGATWTLLQSSNDGANGKHSFVGLSTAGLAWSSKTPTLVVAAFTTSPQAADVGATQTSSVAGLYYSTDAGVTWKMATLYDGANTVQTPQPSTTSVTGNAATSVVWDAQRASFFAAVRAHGYYSSTDGVTWTRLTHQPGTALTTTNCPVGANGLGSANCPIFRGALAVQPATGDLYALTVDSSNSDQGLWQDLCSMNSSGTCASSTPTFTTKLDAGSLDVSTTSPVITQGDYNLTLTAAPTATGTLLFAGTIDLYRCALADNATSCTWRNTTNASNGCAAPARVAPAQHAIAALALNSGTPLLFLGNDGGLWRSTDGVAQTGSACASSDATHFDNLNAQLGAGGSLAEVVGFAQAPNDSGTLLAGLGANGTAATAAASSLTAWTQLCAGEGGYPLIDANNTSNWYATIGAGVNLKACTLGASCNAASFTGAATIGAAEVSNDNALVDAPALLDPALTTNLITATCRAWRGPASSGATWSTSNALSTSFSGGAVPCTSNGPLVRSLAAGGAAVISSNAQSAGSPVLYAGLAGTLDGGTTALGGHLFMTKSANTATNATPWTGLAKNTVTNDASNAGVFNPDGFDISSVVADAHDTTGATVYATVMGFGTTTTTSPHVYRSTDFGAHWSNITSNLPAAPANALAVDPNDANTVYVATDSGVYATQSITTCGTTSCWNLLGTGLPNAPVTSLATAANLATGDGRLGMLRAGTYGRGLWQTPLLAATTSAQPGMSVSPTALTFSAQQVASISATQSITVTSNGSSALSITSLIVSGDFTETDNCAAQTLAVGSTCTIQVAFVPTTIGTRSGTLTLYANVSGGQATIALSGTGTTPATVVLTPASLTFPATTVNQTSAAQIINIANTGGNTATINSTIVSGDFAIAGNTCATTITSQNSCSISVTFAPSASGTRSGTLTVVDSAGTQTALLTGTGNAPATDTLTPTALSFGDQVLNTLSAAQNVTVTNSGDNALTLITAATGSAEFSATNGCGATLAAHSTCAISVAFAPAAVGSRTATLTVSDQFRSQTVALTGNGLAPAGVSLTPSSMAFGEIGVGLSSTAQVVTLTNNGGATLSITSLAPTGDFILAASNCTNTLAASAACSATLIFSPTTAGARTGSLIATTSAGTKSAALSGVGADFSLTSNGATTASLGGSNGSATYPLRLTSVSGLTSSVSLSCAGAPAHATCVVSPSSATLGSTLNVSVIVATGVATLHNERHTLPWMRDLTLYALATPLLWLCIHRRKLLRVLPLLMLMSLSGCGAGRTTPGNGTGSTQLPTPNGSYTLTVSGTAAGVTHSLPLTLTVN